MNAKTTIRKVLFITVWICIGGGMLTLMLAAISKKKKGRCTGYSITIKGVERNYFLDEKDVEALVGKATGGQITGKAIAEINLRQTEDQLEKNTWVRDAELYFDNRDWLHITITEKEPVARVFTVSGISFYIDEKGQRMPLSDKLSARVPVFTGFSDKKILDAKDSVLLEDVRVTAGFILHNPFWMSQVSQVDITGDHGMEMIPVVGSHIVRLGNGENIENKFHRLYVFYQQVLSKTGFEKYKLLDVQYAGQVVASRSSDKGSFDSVQLRKNVEKLIRESFTMQEDTVIRTAPLKQLYVVDKDSAAALVPGLKDPEPDSAEIERNAVPVKPVQHVQAMNQKKDGKQKGKGKPKAIMPSVASEETSRGNN